MFNIRKNEFYNNNDVVNRMDLKKTIVVIDTRFRDSVDSTSPTQFIMKLMKPYKNIIRVRLTSTEFPNVFYTFSEEQHNVKFRLFYDISANGAVSRYTFASQIKTGNYTAEGMRGEMQARLDLLSNEVGNFFNANPDLKTALGLPESFNPQLTILIDDVSARYTIYSDNAAHLVPFGIDFVESTLLTRKHNWGLGYYLGFRERLYSPQTEHTAESFMDTNGHPHLYLELNDYVSCELNNHQNNIECFAVIIQKENKYFSIFGDESTTLTREIVFPQPRDISQFKVRLFDVYGNTVNMSDTDWSFTLELTEVMNPRVYHFYKDYPQIE